MKIKGAFISAVSLFALAAALVAPQAGAATVGWWRFEEGTAGGAATGANSILDSSGNNLNGTPVNGPLYSSDVSPWSSQIGSTRSLHFDGYHHRVYIPDSPTFQLTNGLTIEAIFKAEPMIPGTGGGGNILTRDDTRPGLAPYRLTLVQPGNILIFQIQDLANNYVRVTYTVPYDQWIFAAGTLDGATGVMNLWVNGSIVASTTTAMRPFGPLDPAYSPAVGIGGDPTGQYGELFNGWLDEVRLSDRALSPNEFLVSVPSPNCVSPPAGLVGWWPAEGNANDVAGGNNGTIQPGASFTTGFVGQAFEFIGATNSYVEVPDAPSLHAPTEVTIEFWVKRLSLDFSGHGADYVLEKGGDWTGGAVNYGVALHNPNYNYCLHFTFAGGWRGGGSIADTNRWHHCAIVARTGDTDPALYVDGVQQPVVFGEGAGTINLYASSRPLHIGAMLDPATGWFYYGRELVDELSIYDRALTAAEIQSIYNAGSAGKCSAPTAPTIVSQPRDQTTTVGSSATFAVGAGGSAPLSYQWNFNGAPLDGATGSVLTLTGISMNQAGPYAVVVTNTVGSVTSAVATLTVNFPPALFQVSATGGVGGHPVVVPVALVANGNENALGFSLNFDPTLLTYSSMGVGSGASGAALLINDSQAASGAVGVAVGLTAGTTFSPGTQQVVLVSFTTAILTNPVSTTISFGDAPLPRQLADVNGHPLPANFASGTVSLAASDFEGDVWPRPDGDRVVNISDWVMVGRYAARLDYPTNASEFQRADCAPRSTLGDGQITVIDWVQAGRYAARLDPATLAGGPTSESPTAKFFARKDGGNRQVQVTDAMLLQKQTGTVSITLNAQGNENALGFSLQFATNQLSYQSASLGSGASGALLDVNARNASLGKLGFVLALPSGSSFATGACQVVNVHFQAAAIVSGGSTVLLTDDPVLRQVSDPNASVLNATYVNGTVTINPPPSLTIQRSDGSIILSWPAWAAVFNLEAADSPTGGTNGWTAVPAAGTVTNNVRMVVLPLGGSEQYYRLRQ